MLVGCVQGLVGCRGGLVMMGLFLHRLDDIGLYYIIGFWQCIISGVLFVLGNNVHLI